MTNAVNLASLAVSGGLNADANGDVGVGVTPSPWTLGKALEIGTAPGNGIWGVGASNMNVVSNVYFDGAYKFAGTGSAGTLAMSGGGFAFASSTASGVAGGTISFTDILGASRGNTLYLQGASSQSGTGITFPAVQNASSNANTLDDYEEGTWTPTLPNGGTFTVISARYVKIGQQVTVSFHVSSVAPTNNGSDFLIGGLPFVNAGYSDFYTGGSFGYTGDSSLTNWYPITGFNYGYIYFHIAGNTSRRTNAQYITAAAGATDAIIATITYFAAT